MEITIDGFMGIDELNWLHEHARMMMSVVEVGSWRGRSTYVLCHGCPGMVYAVDHFNGSKEHQGLIDDREVGVFPDFMRNVGHFNNLKVLKMTSREASDSDEIPREVDMVFIDGAHDYDSVMSDLTLWSPRAKMLCGHDKSENGVPRALKDYFGRELPIAVGTIWVRDKLPEIVIPKFITEPACVPTLEAQMHKVEISPSL